ncbi:MAG: hypothetical protein IKP72_00635 [Clostridia bacterium]|nr:hypothetical protein [Clostridia bacterium]
MPGHCLRLFAGNLLHPFAAGLQSVHLRLIEPTPGALRLFVHIEMHEVAEGVRLLVPHQWQQVAQFFQLAGIEFFIVFSSDPVLSF